MPIRLDPRDLDSLGPGARAAILAATAPAPAQREPPLHSQRAAGGKKHAFSHSRDRALAERLLHRIEGIAATRGASSTAMLAAMDALIREAGNVAMVLARGYAERSTTVV